jgi:hypothetical protein
VDIAGGIEFIPSTKEREYSNHEYIIRKWFLHGHFVQP